MCCHILKSSDDGRVNHVATMAMSEGEEDPALTIAAIQKLLEDQEPGEDLRVTLDRMSMTAKWNESLKYASECKRASECKELLREAHEALEKA
jgi:hypothetical protein